MACAGGNPTNGRRKIGVKVRTVVNADDMVLISLV